CAARKAGVSLFYGSQWRGRRRRHLRRTAQAWEEPMSETRRGPRNYKIFICHRYGDTPLYASLRHTLNSAHSFAWTNLSVQTDRPLRLRTDNGLKTSLTHKVKTADLMLVFAHSSGKWIEHEIDAAVRFGVPIIAVLDPSRLGQRKARSR